MKISIQSFGGVSPRTNPRYLDNSGAQVALNVEAFGQSVKPLKGLGTALDLGSYTLKGGAQTIYRYGQDVAANTENQYWFSWDKDVDVCRSQIAGDAKEFTFYTGDIYPKATWSDIAKSASGVLPTQSVRLGLSPPTAPLLAARNDTPVPATTAAEVTLTQGDIDQIDTRYGIKVSLDGGATWVETKNFTASAAPSVTIGQAEMDTMRPQYGVKVSIDGGYTWASGILGWNITSRADAHWTTTVLAGLTDAMLVGFSTTTDTESAYFWVDIPAIITAESVVGALNATGSPVEAWKAPDGGVYLRAKTANVSLYTRAKATPSTPFASSSLWGAAATPSTLQQQADNLKYGIDNALTSGGEALATATVNAGSTTATVTITAKYQGKPIDLMVRWADSGPTIPAGTTIYKSATTRPAITAASLAAAITALAGVAATVADGAVKVSTDTQGASTRLIVKWGEGSGQQRGSSGTTEDLGNVETRVYTYTRVYYPLGWSATEEMPSWESPPWQGVLASTDPYAGSTVNAFVDEPITLRRDVSGSDPDALSASEYPAASGVLRYRLYRSVDGVFLYVSEVSSADSTVGKKDARHADALGEPIPSTDYDRPPDNLAGLINLPNGMMAGFAGRDVYFCEPYKPYAWPLPYVQTVDYPVVGLGRMDTTLVVLTKGTPYFMQGASPDYITIVKSDLEQACVSKRSIVSLDGAVIYASPDGLVALSSSGSIILTDGLFTRDKWQALGPSSIQAWGHDGKYIATHTAITDGGVTYRGFVVDLRSKQFVRHDIDGLAAGYSDLRNDKLFLLKSGAIQAWGQGDNLPGRWRSKKFALPQITGFTCAQVEAEDYTGLKCAIYRDGAKHGTELAGDALTPPAGTARVDGRYPFRLDAAQGRDWEIDLTVTQEVFNVTLAQAMSEIASV